VEVLDVITGIFYTLKFGRYVVWDVLRWVHFVCLKVSREDLPSELISLFSSVPDIFCFFECVSFVLSYSAKLKVQKIEFSAVLRMWYLRRVRFLNSYSRVLFSGV
jgi:hypothetical protein